MKLALAAAVLTSALVVGQSRTGACDPAPRVLQYWHDQSVGPGAAHDALMIQLDAPVAAVVARWTFGDATTEWTVGPRTDAAHPGVSVVELGDLGGSPTLVMRELAAGGHLDLTAIGADGARVAIRGLPARLATDEMPTDDTGLGRALASVPPPTVVRAAAPVVSPLPADWNPMRGLDDALWWALGAIGLLTLGVIAAFRLRPALRDPNA